MNKCSFTFFEMLVVAAIMTMIAVVALPNLGKRTRRIEVESALSAIRQAIGETAMRARANGTALKITVDTENSTFQVSSYEQPITFPQEWVPSPEKPEDAPDVTASAIAAKDAYEIPGGIEWLPEETGLDEYDSIDYAFFEDGAAAGRPLQFRLAGRMFQMDVDKLTGDPLIMEFDD